MTSTEREQILMDLFNKKKPRIVGKEADEFRETLQAEIDEMAKKGIMVDIPSEWQIPKNDSDMPVVPQIK